MNQFKLTIHPTILFASCLLLFQSVFIGSTPDLSLTFANTLLVHAVIISFSFSNKESVNKVCFNAGFLVSVASLVYLPLLYLLAFVLVTLSIFRPIRIKEWLIVLTASLVPYLLMFTICFWFDYGLGFIHDHFLTFYSISNTVGFSSVHLGILSLGLILLLWVGQYVLPNYSRFSVAIRNHLSSMIWLFLFVFIIVGTHLRVSELSIQLLSLPLALFTSFALANSTKNLFPEIVHGILFLALIYQQYLIFAD